jgi:hypothetical protein
MTEQDDFPCTVEVLEPRRTIPTGLGRLGFMAHHSANVAGDRTADADWLDGKPKNEAGTTCRHQPFCSL